MCEVVRLQRGESMVTYTYHVTNVREDATIPQFEPPHWELLNTFRTQAQIEDGGVCKPKPEG